MVSSMTLIDFPISKADVVSKLQRHTPSREERLFLESALTRLKSIIKHLGKLAVELMSFFSSSKNQLGNGRLQCFLKSKANLLSLPKFV